MTFTDKQWELLKQASLHFENARRERVRNAPRWLTQQVIDVYEAATGKKMLHKDLSCAVCVLRVYQTIGKLYFDDLKYHQSNNDTMTSDKNIIETKYNEQGSQTKKRNAKPKTGDKKKKK